MCLYKHAEAVPYAVALLNGIWLYGQPIRLRQKTGGLLFKHVFYLKGVMLCFLKISIWCIWCNRTTCFNVQKTHYFSNTVHYCSPSMPASLKRLVFY